MKRKMLIIANPGERDAENYCEGVNQDVTRYHRFFTSIQGGAWKTDEIKTLIRPEPREVDLALSELKSADYSMVIFCGHGYSRKNGTTMVELYKDCDYDSDKFNQGAKRHTVILDCCRIVYEPVSESVSNHYELRASADHLTALQHARDVFDDAVRRCPPGLAVLYACSLDETAEDNEETGGVYSHALRSAALQLSETLLGSETASVVRIHNNAAQAVRRETGGHQNPTITKPRSEPYFPFCVSSSTASYMHR